MKGLTYLLFLILINHIFKILGQEGIKPIQQLFAESYDFVIVGAGSAGCVIANRLSEVRQWKILLLEAGEEEDKFHDIPAFNPALQFSKHNWRFFMQYQPNVVLGCENHLMPWPRGKGLGGSSLIDYMLYSRGHSYEYDEWAAQGNPGWSYREVLPYFIKSEDCRLTNADFRYHGFGGYLTIEDTYQSKVSDAFLGGMKELGFSYIDYNANTTLGVSILQATTDRGRRHTVAKAFIEPIKHRRNLRVLTRAFVTRILINPQSKVAYGVEYEWFGQKFRALANKEVILSAGVFNSPQLLMLSGIGRKKHLEELKIPLIKDLPVGQNLQDTWAFMGLSFLTDQDVTLRLHQISHPENIHRFFFNGTGPLTSLGGTQAVGYIRTDQSEDTKDHPDVELLFVGTSLAFDYGAYIRTGMGISDEVYNAVYGPLEGKNSFMIVPVLLHPKSRGYIKLKSKNPKDYPLLYGNIFTDPENKDLNTLLAGIRFAQKLLKTKSFKRFHVLLNPNRVPGCTKFLFDSDNYWKCALRYLAQTLHHLIGTAKMGPKNDPGAVVNNFLKVHGIGKLRVADCSVIPIALGGRTYAPAIMIGEKVSDLIKFEWINKKTN